MAVWAIADLHLSFGVPDKGMDLFGAQWLNHPEKIRTQWERLVSPDDLVLLPGDISWAMRLEDAVPDLAWIESLPGTKVMIRGNHDYWWTSLSKMEKVIPPSIHFIQNNVFIWNGMAIAGSRLWDTPEYNFGSFIEFIDNPRANKLTNRDDPAESEKIFVRELSRLEMSLKQIPAHIKTRLAMTHYPPIGADLKESRASLLLEKYGITDCVFGHLHNIKPQSLPFGTKNGVCYKLTSCDYCNFTPILIKDT